MSPFMALLAITQIALADISGDPVVVHSPIANRTRHEAATAGWFAHSLPFPAAPEPTSTLGETFLDLRRTILLCVRNHAMPLPAIVLALSPDSHGSARSLRPPRFFFTCTETDEASADDFPFAESEVLGDAQRWAEPGLSVYWERQGEPPHRRVPLGRGPDGPGHGARHRQHHGGSHPRPRALSRTGRWRRSAQPVA